MATSKHQAHPAADLWPMLGPEDLQALADDITANGLQQPIVLDRDGLILDGRNRRAACRLAGVQPTFTTVDVPDPVAYVLSMNLQRRHLTGGQRAILAVQASKLEGFGTRAALARAVGVPASRITEAEGIVRAEPDLAAAVVRGEVKFSVALQQVQAIGDQLAEQERIISDSITETTKHMYALLMERRAARQQGRPVELIPPPMADVPFEDGSVWDVWRDWLGTIRPVWAGTDEPVGGSLGDWADEIYGSAEGPAGPGG